MKSSLKILVLLISGITYSQNYNIPEQQNSEALKSIKIIESIMHSLDTTFNATWETNRPEKIDSICYSHKTQFDILLEKNGRYREITQLGNRLEYYDHTLGELKVRYVIFDNNLWKIKFNFDFTYVNTDDTLYYYQPSINFLDSIKTTTQLPIKFEYSVYEKEIMGYSYTFVFPRIDYELRKYFKGKLKPYMEVKNKDSEFKKDVEFVNDPINLLVYGFACGIGGTPPDGLWEFAKIIHYKKIYLAEELLFSPNPVTRLMAHDAVEFYIKTNFYFPGTKIIKQLKEIEKDETIIRTCWGCSFENISMKEANIKAAGNKKHLYEDFIFLKNF
ncbi:MAG: hypothetical protein J0M37_03500 [Ignavibacteria bacterium]|nr:hypothetical protein [Ignavibacteria bacterium]